ncbi:MAG: tRNA (adenosine(37)-N6)-dimethylallyltransferase MiaA [Legionellales bacterium]|jgi:tRNA dimethylallyltransferase|nr:tRNA (adenosine(37)-N6)-dimethylallyltransferase MiaA [Legionellales bacterium]
MLNKEKKEDILCIVGPTCSGKTALACDFVDRFDFEIVSVDSVMIYKGLDIGTAKPSTKEQIRYPHHLIDICDPSEVYSVGRFCIDVATVIESIYKKGKRPLLVGGTAMYFHVLQNGMHELPVSTPDSKQHAIGMLNKHGNTAAYNNLAEIDPVSAKRINPADTQRLIRALEVYYLTGSTITELCSKSAMSPEYSFKNLILLPDREQLKKDISTRLNIMLDNGFLFEVEELKKRSDLSIRNSSIRSVGYRQAWDYLDNKISLKDFEEMASAATRQLAKRQYTWFRKMEGHRLESLSRGVLLKKSLQIISNLVQ